MSGVFLVSLGCPKNLVDTELFAGTLVSCNRYITFDDRQADIYIINTCAFIPSARNEAAEAIETAIKWKKRAKKMKRHIIVAGCLPQYDKDFSYRKLYPEVDAWMGVNNIPELEKIINSLDAEDKKFLPIIEKNPDYLYNHTAPRLQLTVPHMAYLKIADGCDNCCSYCAIPSIRGKLRSRKLESVVEEAKNLVANGVNELVIIAQDITVFGHDRAEDNENLAKLLTELEKIEGDFKMRLLYTHPAHYTDELIQVIKNSKKILPYLDMPLQHINDRILRDMNRHIDKQGILTLLDKLIAEIPNLVLRTTFITGFPGETEAEFNELMDFIKKYKFQRCGVFGYSPEVNTPAASMPNLIDTAIANERAKILMEIQEKIMLDYQQSFIGKTIEVICDEAENQMAIGRSFADAPEIDNRVIFAGKRLKAGKVYKVEIKEVNDFDLIGFAVQ
ncbi:MAG: 30S ribosomal protein S12 methylthiotransferase RimO [Lentisphaeria bacterium]|nr:30S ribosomal protein S12 methylthiotransferase RimO [Lentisphaeria bacterium]